MAPYWELMVGPVKVPLGFAGAGAAAVLVGLGAAFVVLALDPLDDDLGVADGLADADADGLCVAEGVGEVVEFGAAMACTSINARGASPARQPTASTDKPVTVRMALLMIFICGSYQSNFSR